MFFRIQFRGAIVSFGKINFHWLSDSDQRGIFHVHVFNLQRWFFNNINHFNLAPFPFITHYLVWCLWWSILNWIEFCWTFRMITSWKRHLIEMHSLLMCFISKCEYWKVNKIRTTNLHTLFIQIGHFPWENQSIFGHLNRIIVCYTTIA